MEAHIRPRRPHSNSFGNDAEKDTAGCRALNRKYIVIGSLRFLLGKYKTEDLINGYNQAVQKYILPALDLEANIHILDCTDLEVNYFNTHYEGSGVAYSKRNHCGIKENARGYKLSTIRGIVKDSGVIEEIRLGPLNTHDFALSEQMLRDTPVLKPGDILINDRGFLSRNLINYLKSVRKVDTYVPLKKGMNAYNIAIQVANEEGKWYKHPITRFETQKICLVTDLGPYWIDPEPEIGVDNVNINACVVKDEATNEYFVFATTDTSQTAINILRTYNLRPEIEEDYRQLKEFWRLEDFKSTKLNMIAFHIVSVLFGYLFFQLFTMMDEGQEYARKSLPVVLKNYIIKVQGCVVLYTGNKFGVLTLLAMMELYAHSEVVIRNKLKPIFEKI